MEVMVMKWCWMLGHCSIVATHFDRLSTIGCLGAAVITGISGVSAYNTVVKRNPKITIGSNGHLTVIYFFFVGFIGFLAPPSS